MSVLSFLVWWAATLALFCAVAAAMAAVSFRRIAWGYLGFALFFSLMAAVFITEVR